MAGTNYKEVNRPTLFGSGSPQKDQTPRYGTDPNYVPRPGDPGYQQPSQQQTQVAPPPSSTYTPSANLNKGPGFMGGGSSPLPAMPPSMSALLSGGSGGGASIPPPTGGAPPDSATGLAKVVDPGMSSVSGLNIGTGGGGVTGMSSGESTEGFLGNPTGSLRALGRRSPPMESTDVAQRGKRVY